MSDSIYEKMAEYYDDIFDYSSEAADFVEQKCSGQKILDIGCGTGALALDLVHRGYELAGLDLSSKMIEEANKNKSDLPIHFFKVGDMNESFDFPVVFKPETVLCLGNSLVHLENEQAVASFFKRVWKLLPSGGRFIIQILNYDLIMSESLFALPDLGNRNVTFRREYSLLPDHRLLFSTEIELPGEPVLKGEAILLPIKKEALADLLTDAGFSSVQWFNDYKMNEKSGFVRISVAEKM